LDEAVAAMGVRVLRTPFRAPQANARCERVIGTIRRECLDFLIPLGQRHLKHTLNRWILHYNHGRVHNEPGTADGPAEADVDTRIGAVME